MNWPIIWGVIKFDKVENVTVPDNFFVGDRISVRFSKDKSFNSADCFGREGLKLNKNEISFEIMCSTWRPKDLNNNEELWCTSDMDYFCPDEIEVTQKQHFSKVFNIVLKERKREFTYVFDMLYMRLKDLQNTMMNITSLPNIKEVVFYFTDSHGDIEVDKHEFWNWKVEEFADEYLNFSWKLIEEGHGYFSDIIPSYYLTYKTK